MKSLLISAMVMLSATTASAFDYVVTGNAAPEMEGKMFYLLDDNSNLSAGQRRCLTYAM